mmetsp:Transcript_5510/g.9814  ORF Transcript_5510/g.9814 Transcript_5510/m.9814 type:complete len:450 (-) Transcript_5510:4-1353(-)|eukprot:CAMPEP_0203769866 /NCGR_PEP_ID=MMETSP0099_2-20121227/2451_1 /ASSEMBLY_ACC=CAM_ASM_000209 /TAXON_ID=96639 /ORGANISM=" , Strain NY0313808BC1" /LENGTH=449 /DNA_ID=CAMNT_0050666855 /DNA_START=366 /DNA_END=1715 /DNA_ORIENTATION=+
MKSYKVANSDCKQGELAVKKKRRRITFANRGISTKLQLRQISAAGGFQFNSNQSSEQFKGFKPGPCLDAHDTESSDVKLCFLRKRSKVVEIVAAKHVIFGLTQTGVCTAFCRKEKKRICFLNTAPDEVIRSLFYNKSNNSLITVSVYREDSYSSLKCRSTPLEYIQREQPEAGFSLFESESLRWPGFVEFDDVNGKVLTYSARDKIYKVWDLVNYTLLYSMNDKDIQEIKISPGIMLLIYNRSPCQAFVPLKILAIETGEVLKAFKHPLHEDKKIDFIEQFNEKLLVKQENGNLQIVDVRTSEWHEVPSTDFMTPTAFIFLYENQLFLTFRDHQVAVWNFRGELITTFQDHVLWHPDCNTNNIYITGRQDLIISYCKNENSLGCGSINISDILTGVCLSKIASDGNQGGEGANDKFTKGLEDVTALYYNEELNEIYTGNRHGMVYIWSN